MTSLSHNVWHVLKSPWHHMVSSAGNTEKGSPTLSMEYMYIFCKGKEEKVIPV